jgi:hypothetical protein
VGGAFGGSPCYVRLFHCVARSIVPDSCPGPDLRAEAARLPTAEAVGCHCDLRHGPSGRAENFFSSTPDIIIRGGLGGAIY